MFGELNMRIRIGFVSHFLILMVMFKWTGHLYNILILLLKHAICSGFQQYIMVKGYLETIYVLGIHSIKGKTILTFQHAQEGDHTFSTSTSTSTPSCPHTEVIYFNYAGPISHKHPLRKSFNAMNGIQLYCCLFFGLGQFSEVFIADIHGLLPDALEVVLLRHYCYFIQILGINS